MLLEEIKNIKSTKKELRSFGLTVGTVFGILAFVLWWKEKTSFIYLAEASAILIVLGTVLPIVLKPLQKVWMAIALIIGFIMTRVILAVLYYVILTPLSLISRLFGKAFLDLKIDKSVASYWVKRPELGFSKERYEKQF